jgi:hypothetical protein
MTGRIALAALLVLATETAAQEPEPWPGKGDSVYIAASFKGLTGPSTLPGTRAHYDMPACVKLLVVKAKPKKQIWTIDDPMGGTLEISGAWTVRMHRGKTECEAQLSVEGEPAMGRDQNRFTLVKALKKQ